MILECKIEEVLFSKLENLGVLCQPYYHSQFFLMRIEKERILFTESSTAKHSTNSNNVLAFAVGNRAVKAGDFVFRLQYSSILFAFRYEGFSFMPISRIYNLKRLKTSHQHHGSSDHYHELQATLLQEIRAPMYVKIRNPILAVEYGPKVLLEVIEHTIVDDEFNFDDWLQERKAARYMHNSHGSSAQLISNSTTSVISSALQQSCARAIAYIYYEFNQHGCLRLSSHYPITNLALPLTLLKLNSAFPSTLLLPLTLFNPGPPPLSISNPGPSALKCPLTLLPSKLPAHSLG